MKKNFNTKDLPNKIPVFPLSNAIFFPNTVLPLNIFEPRYKQMTEHALNQNGIIGMVQTTQEKDENNKPVVYDVGCLGYIDQYSNTPDGRYLINLKGVSRFRIINEVNSENMYRLFEVNYDEFKNDQSKNKDLEVDILELIDKAKKFFKKNQLITDWKIVEKVEPSQLINSLAMICPFTVSEKQRLLETLTVEERNEVLNQIINFYILDNNLTNNKKVH